ncbi:type I polyketide synthase [Nocardia abscessus]|uniref:type I polyketide synthase n=1 Tax=Nocardia abscessus TaxID=120957 RepID=UPI0002DE6EC1|nr:type I polyketide synthase [Nocardia abscessus]MCC3332253.1 type I polyketide synthase [Nocardia abscessus]
MTTEQTSPVKQALAAMRTLQTRLDRELMAKTEPIAVIGIGCRVPGGGCGPDEFWQLLDDGVDAITEVPPDRWVGEVGSPARWGGFLSDVDAFDAAFFGIAPREAEAMDPQQRLLLEVAWEALEQAGHARLDRLAGSRTGVFTGVVVTDYDRLSLGNRDIYTVTGNGHSFPAGRLSYVLGLQGPSMVVDTACSSSLVAVHLAVQSLRSGESEMALAGGVNLMLAKDMTDMLASSRALSEDGRCKTFDALANGYVRGEGCGMLVLRRLSDAVADGDPVLAVIRGSAVNSDGRSSGLTAPNVSAQKALLRQALRSARADAADISYVETHGTGTPLGDPIEVDALADVLGGLRDDGSRCVLGAVKTNIGHLEAAAGVIGLIKVVLALQRERIPANLHLRTVNPRIDLTGTALVLPSDPVSWPKHDGATRMAGVSSFGISGTNAHVIVADPPESAEPPATEPGPALVPISARDAGALTDLVSAFRAEFDERQAEVPDIAYTAAVRRHHHQYRAALVLPGEGPPRLVPGPEPDERPRVVFVFSGQGSQWLGMGRALLAGEPAFRAAVEACDHAIQKETGWSVIDELTAQPSTSRLDRVDVVQPVLFAMEVALAALWRSKGIQPDAVIGHSMGEVAAAHVAGALTLTDATRIICRRSRLLRGLAGRGAMALVELPSERASAVLSGFADQVSIAASNSARSTVLSGDPDALDEVLAELTGAGVFCRRIKVEVAAHSPQVDAITDELSRQLGALTPEATTVPMWSTVLGKVCDGAELDTAYWIRNLREPVLFAEAVRDCMALGRTIFVELTPHPILLPSIEEDGGLVVPSGRCEHDERAVFLESLAALYVRGCQVDWPALHPRGGRCVPLPAYPWRRQRYWVDRTPAARADHGHPLLGEPVSPATSPGTRIWERELSLPYLADHMVDGAVVFPASGYVEMALGACGRSRVLEDLAFDRMAILANNGSGHVQFIEQADHFQVYCRAARDEPWVLCAHGSVRPGDGRLPMAEPPSSVRDRCGTEVAVAEHYARYAGRAIDYGPTFRGVQRIWTGDGEGVALVELTGLPSGYVCHPALLDACFQVLGSVLLDRRASAGVIPVRIDRLRVHRPPGGRVWVHARARSTEDSGDLLVLDDDGTVLIEVEGLTVARPAEPTPYRDWLYRVAWRAAERLVAPDPGEGPLGTWLVLTDSTGVGTALATLLEQRGQTCVLVDKRDIDIADDDAWSALLDDVAAGGERACVGVVHLWSLDTTSTEHVTADTLSADQHITGLSTVRLVRALARLPMRDHPRLWLVTKGAQQVGPEPVEVSQAPLWGLARTLSVEHPELECVRVDLRSGWGPTRCADELLPELVGADGEDEIALREGGRNLARLVRASFEPGDVGLSFARGTYLISGGLGGLGIGLARWLAAHGARHLVLAGRHDPVPDVQARIEELRREGVEVVVARADVARRQDVAAMLADIDERLPPLRGVLHAAMVLDDRTIRELDAERYDRVLAPKMRGAWNLHELTEDRELEFFVMYSSASALLGSPGQANYAAANAFLGALARHRVHGGRKALCVDWGLYSQEGIMAERNTEGQRLAHRGIGTLTPEQGMDILGLLLGGSTSQIAAANLDLRQWLAFYPVLAGASLFTELGDDGRESASRPSDPWFTDRLRAATAAERPRLIDDLVTEQLGRILHLDADSIDRKAPLTTMGVDSLMALELRNRLEAALGVRLSATLMYTAPTVRALTEQLLDVLGMAEPQEATDEFEDLGDLLAQIDGSIERLERRQRP